MTQVIPLGSHDLFLAEVAACDVDESLLDENGKLCLDKARLIVYSHGEYLALGKKLGTFGYSVRKKKSTAEITSPCLTIRVKQTILKIEKALRQAVSL